MVKIDNPTKSSKSFDRKQLRTLLRILVQKGTITNQEKKDILDGKDN
jgi:hypothetical protein